MNIRFELVRPDGSSTGIGEPEALFSLGLLLFGWSNAKIKRHLKENEEFRFDLGTGSYVRATICQKQET